MTDYLSGKAELTKVLWEDIIGGVALIARGVPVSEQFRQSGRGLPDLIRELEARYDRIIFVDTPQTRDRFLLAETLPSCPWVMVIVSGKHTIHSILRASMHCSSIIVNQIPFRANIFSFQGIKELIIHLVRDPVKSLSSVLRS